MNWTYLNVKTEVTQGVKSGLEEGQINDGLRLGWMRRNIVGERKEYHDGFLITFPVKEFRPFVTKLRESKKGAGVVASTKRKVMGDVETR